VHLRLDDPQIAFERLGGRGCFAADAADASAGTATP